MGLTQNKTHRHIFRRYVHMRVKNPVIPGFHPDPSLVRVGEDYYIATSTFEWFPGVRIYHSKDLANWKIVSYGLTQEAKVDLTGIDSACGIWAPNLTYDNGIFYLAFTIVYTNRSRFKDTHNYVITAKDIKGPWSDPVPLSRSGFDPSIFHDTNGKKYLVNMTLNYRENKNRFSGIDVQEYDYINERLAGDPVRVFLGTPKGKTEGPNIMKHNDWYYLVCAEGGTGKNHCVTVVRSKNIYGPYEECPFNPVMTSAGKAGCKLKRAGHGQVIEGLDGNWYMAHLCSRPLKGYSILGRETGIQNIIWTKDDWFRLSDNNNGSPALYFNIPGEVKIESDRSQRVEFKKDKIPLDYMTLRRSFKSNGIKIEDGVLRIKGGCSVSSKFQQGLIARPLQCFTSDFTTGMKFRPRHLNHLAGLLVYYNYDNYYHLRVTRDEKGAFIHLSAMINKEITDEEVAYLPQDFDICYLRAKIRHETVQFYYSLDGVNYIESGKAQDMKNISDEHVNGNGFTGAMVGVNCVDLQGDGVYADFLFLDYKEFID